MKVGVVGTFGSAERIVEMGVAAEAAGWDGFFSWDGISVGPMDTFDPWVLLGAVAVRTERITLGAMVFALPRRQPWKVARESITVDRLSGGRLVMPVGLGAVDDAAFSRVSGGVTDRRTRAELLDDTLAILDRAWSGETFSYQGTHHAVTDIVFQPKPVAQPRIPVWVVGAYPSARSMGRALRWDGVIPQRTDRPPMTRLLPADVAEIADYVTEHRGDAGPFDIVVEGQLPDDASDAAELLAQFEDAGATWWIESHWSGDTAEPDNLLELIRRGPAGPAVELNGHMLFETLAAVLADSPVPVPDAAVEQDPEVFPGGREDADYHPDQTWVVRIERNRTTLPADRDLARTAIVSTVQDWVIATLGRPWPELVDDAGGFIGVLEPEIDGSRLVWAVRGADAVCPRYDVGTLGDHLRPDATAPTTPDS